MNNQHHPDERAITWRTQIHLAPDKDGYLTSTAVDRAARPFGEKVSDVIELVVKGRLTGVDPWALLPFGKHLAAATQINTIGHGRGMPQLHEAIENAITQERQWAADDAQLAEMLDEAAPDR